MYIIRQNFYTASNPKDLFHNIHPKRIVSFVHAIGLTSSLLLLLVWHAPLGVRSAKRRHQSPEWTILSHSYRLIQREIV